MKECKFKVGDWVRFNIWKVGDVKVLKLDMGIDPTKPYKIISVTWSESNDEYLYDMDVKNGDGWIDTWLILDKKSTVLDIIRGL